MTSKVLFLLASLSLASFFSNAQKGVRIGYIDTEYILQNIPEYKEAESQLNKKALQWKNEVEIKMNTLKQKKKELENESVLLTKELYDERAEELAYEESLILDYQQRRFGPSGDLMIQKRQLIEPVQDQIFAVVQDIAETQKLDFVFDKSADVVMLYAAERYDISERVLRTITRASKRKETKGKKERKALEEEDIVVGVDKDKEARQKELDDKKAAKEAEFAKKREDRVAAAAARKKELEELRAAKRLETAERRQKALDARTKKAEDTQVKTDDASTKTKATDSTATDNVKETPNTSSTAPKTSAEELLEEKRQQKLKDKEDRKKELEARKKKIADDRKKIIEARRKKADSLAEIRKTKANN